MTQDIKVMIMARCSSWIIRVRRKINIREDTLKVRKRSRISVRKWELRNQEEDQSQKFLKVSSFKASMKGKKTLISFIKNN
jgi:hypothetical protein